MSHTPATPAAGEHQDLPRRSFLSKALATVIGGIVGLVPAIPAVMYFLDPLTRKKRAVGISGSMIDDQGFIKITTREALSDTPRSFRVIADLRNFWNKFPNTEVGSVFLWQDPETKAVSCFNTRCPHLGCTVKYEDASKTFVCPCHASAFSLGGERTNEIPPRNMDSLDHHVNDDGTVSVKFEKFRAGIHEKVPL